MIWILKSSFESKNSSKTNLLFKIIKSIQKLPNYKEILF